MGTLEETAYLQHHPLGGLRRAVNDAIRRGLPVVSLPGLDHRPVQLHVMHFWGGGSTGHVSAYGPVGNPWNTDHCGGGSSGMDGKT